MESLTGRIVSFFVLWFWFFDTGSQCIVSVLWKLDKGLVVIEKRCDAVSGRAVCPRGLNLAVFESLVQIADAGSIRTHPFERLQQQIITMDSPIRVGSLRRWCV